MSDDLSSDDCSVSVGSMKGVSIIEAAGEIDLANVSLLAKALHEAAGEGGKDVLLDAQNLTYIDPTGIQTLLSWSQHLTSEGGSFAIIGCHGVFHKLIEGNKLNQRLPMYSSLDEAISMIHTNR